MSAKTAWGVHQPFHHPQPWRGAQPRSRVRNSNGPLSLSPQWLGPAWTLNAGSVVLGSCAGAVWLSSLSPYTYSEHSLVRIVSVNRCGWLGRQ